MDNPQHIIEAQQFDKEFLAELFTEADVMKKIVEEDGVTDILHNKIMAALFYEPSTRTRFSFEAAMRRLGGNVITTENAAEFSSATKGETLEDSIRTVNGYVDVIVMRHTEVGAASRAAAVSAVPVINAGDGAGQHPTQALLDLYTIFDELGSPEDKTICFVGDLLYGRTVHSLIYLLAKYDVSKIICVAPKVVALKPDLANYIKEKGIVYEETEDLAHAAEHADVIYQTRIQKERFDNAEDYEKASGEYVINKKILDVMKDGSIIMHPLPRSGEIAEGVDGDARAAYFRQAQNGLFVRMALLKRLLS